MPQGQAKMSHCIERAAQAFSSAMRVSRDIHGLAGRKGPAACQSDEQSSQETFMKTILATAIAAVTVAGLSFGAMAAPVVTTRAHTKTVVVVKHPAHWHQHHVCKTVWHHHHKKTVCTWVNDKK
jgi:hypothetical protein